MTADLATVDATLLDRAIRKAEESEVPFYESVQLMKQAAGELRPLLQERNRYFTAVRAMNRIAQEPCESGDFIRHAGVEDCNAAVLTCELPEDGRCWPCYARHVLTGGTP